jgi:UPF0271 protein
VGSTVDLNADLGETAGDLELIGVVTSANIACGAHAGDLPTMREACERAVAAGVAIGAHPGYPDRPAMGRKELGMPAADVVALVAEQVATLRACAAAAGGALAYVKLHGALYHRAGRDADLAEALAVALAALDPPPAVLAQPDAALLAAATRLGMRTATEGYCDRGYRPDGSLVPRGEPGALLAGPEEAAAQALEIATWGGVTTAEGAFVPVEVESLCLHGDTPGALATARRVRARLEAAGVLVESFVA